MRTTPETMTKNNNQPLLTHTECSALRGIAIIGIFLHNYCHWLGFAVKENEYTFRISNSNGLMSALLSPDSNLPIHLLSFFGHYGVPVFLFLSAYGLVMKYEDGGRYRPERRRERGKGLAAAWHAPHGMAGPARQSWEFMRTHYLKLFKMMIVGFVTFTMVDAVTPGRHHYAVTDILGQMFMFNNLLPDPDRVIWPGPYWFFGLMLQLYIVYRIFLYRQGWRVVVALILTCWLLQALCAPDSDTLNRIRYNFMGGMLPFGAGLLFARHGQAMGRDRWMTVTAVSATATLFFSMNFHTWLWAPLMACAASIGIVKLLPGHANKWLSWFGTISAALFVMHPVTRKIFIPISRQGDVYTGLLLYAIASVAVAWAAGELIKRIRIG